MTLDLGRKLRTDLATPAIINFYATQLACYASNDDATNDAIAEVLWRVVGAEALNLEPLLYQVSHLVVVR